MQFLGEALVWAAENLWALILHITGRSSFPKPLTAAEEAEYIRRMGEGDGKARDALIEHNLRLVAHIAKKYQGGALDADDMVSIGAIGLIKAVNTFRPEAGKLTTYASRCIENEILMQLRASRRSRLTVQLDDPIGTDKEGTRTRSATPPRSPSNPPAPCACCKRNCSTIGSGASFKCATACSTARPARSTRWPKRWASRVPTYRASKKRRWRSFAGRWAVEAPPSLCYNGLAAQKVARQGGSPCTTTTLSPPCF